MHLLSSSIASLAARLAAACAGVERRQCRATRLPIAHWTSGDADACSGDSWLDDRSRRSSRRFASVRALRTPLFGCALLVLSACAAYHALPLDRSPPAHLALLTVPAATLLPGGLKSHPFDPSNGLDATEVAMLAVVQSPDLKVRRAQAQVTRAQAFAAGLLPDPVIGFTRDRPNAGQPGASTAYSRALSWDVASLVTYASRQTARRRTDEQVDLGLLWAEWQTIAGSRLEFVRIQRGRELVARLEAESAVLRWLKPRQGTHYKSREGEENSRY